MKRRQKRKPVRASLPDRGLEEARSAGWEANLRGNLRRGVAYWVRRWHAERWTLDAVQAEAAKCGDALAHHTGNVLAWDRESGGVSDKEYREAVDILARGVAALSFYGDGVRIFGSHFRHSRALLRRAS